MDRSDTLEHIEDDDSVFQEFGRILKPSGKLILSVPYGATNSAELFLEQKILRRLIPHKKDYKFQNKKG